MSSGSPFERIHEAIALLEEHGYLVCPGLLPTQAERRAAIKSPEGHKGLSARVRIEITKRGGRAWEIRQGKGTPPGSSNMIMFGGPPGHSDVVAIVRAKPWARTHFLELKSGKDRQRKNQRNFEAMIRDQGGDYRVVRSLADIDDIRPDDS